MSINIVILVSAVYKPPNAVLNEIDLDTQTKSFDWTIAARNYNSKHLLLIGETTNIVGTILYNHV